MAKTSKKITKEELNRLIKEAFLEYAFSMNEEESEEQHLSEEQEALMEDELEEIQIFNKLFGGSKDFSKGQQLGSSLGSALSPGAGRAVGTDQPATKPAAKPKPVVAKPVERPLYIDLPVDSGDADELELTRESANVALLKKVIKEMIRKEQANVKLREAIQKEVYKNPQKTEKYVSQLKGNLETGKVGLKNLINARNHASDDDERDAIQGLIDKHPHTKKSMYKAE